MEAAPTRERPRTPQAVFDRVAPYYDTMNAMLSFGIDRSWRRAAVEALRLRPGLEVLDVATGTGALAAEILAQTGGSVAVIGCDLNDAMLSVAQKRIKRLGGSAELVRCDATELPFPDDSFDAATLAFAIDDMPDRDACVSEILRVLRPGGRLSLLELSQPTEEPYRSVYRLYLRTFRLLRRFRVEGYDHLEQEILTYRGAEAIKQLLGRAGFVGYERRSLTGGIARLHVAEKRPQRAVYSA